MNRSGNPVWSRNRQQAISYHGLKTHELDSAPSFGDLTVFRIEGKADLSPQNAFVTSQKPSLNSTTVKLAVSRRLLEAAYETKKPPSAWSDKTSGSPKFYPVYYTRV